MKRLIIILTLLFSLLSSTPITYAQHDSPEGSLVTTVGQPVDWQQFWVLFKEYALWDLEWYDGSEWVSVKTDLTIERTYPEPNRCKVNLVFDASHAGNYRLTHAINKVVKDHITRVDQYQYDLTYKDIMITFDWSDCAGIPGLQFSHGIKDGYFWFRIRRDNVPLGAHVEIDPATVATSTEELAVTYGYMRKGFYAEGLFWAFYSDGTNAGWEFSNDGTTWVGAFTSIGACLSGVYLSVWFDGTYVHYIRFHNNDLFYRRGAVINDGSINWSAVEQTVYDGVAADTYRFPCISVDTNGYAWVGVWYDKPDGDDLPVVLKNANNDGTWALDFAYELSAVDDIKWRVCPVPLTGGKVYVVYCRSGQLPLGNLYDAGWGGEENDLADHAIEQGYQFSAVAIGDNVHFIYNRDITYQIRHNERVWGVGWDAADVLVQDNLFSDTGPALSGDPSTGDLYCFWTNNDVDHVYYKQYSGGAWDGAATDWIDESTDDIQLDYLISSYYMDYGGYIGLLYVTKLASPYNVRFEFLTTPALPDTTLPTSTGLIYNETHIRYPCQFTTTLNDETALSHYTFGWNASGAWVNMTAVNMGGVAEYNVSVIRTLPLNISLRIGAELYFNDTSDNWGSVATALTTTGDTRIGGGLLLIMAALLGILTLLGVRR